MIGDPRTRHSLLGMKVLDWQVRKFGQRPGRLLWPDLAGETDLVRTQIVRWAPPGTFIFTQRLDWCLPWWEQVPTWTNWAQDLELSFLPIVRTQQDLNSVRVLKEAGFPMQRLILQCFPKEPLDLIGLKPDAVWVGARGPEWMPSYIMRREWIDSLERQAECPFAFRSWGSWWPKDLGGTAWAERDGYIRGPSPPPAGKECYPPWLTLDRRASRTHV